MNVVPITTGQDFGDGQLSKTIVSQMLAVVHADTDRTGFTQEEIASILALVFPSHVPANATQNLGIQRIDVSIGTIQNDSNAVSRSEGITDGWVYTGSALFSISYAITMTLTAGCVQFCDTSVCFLE